MDKPARVFQPRDNNGCGLQSKRLDIVVTAQAAHVNKDVPSEGIQLPPEFFMLVFIATEVEKLFARIGYVWPQIISANIGPQTHALDSKASAVMKLKNTARRGRSRRLLKTGAAHVADDKPRVGPFEKLRIMSEPRYLKATDSFERPANVLGGRYLNKSRLR
jgi:hypothetical protein